MLLIQAGDSLTDVLRERHAVVTLWYGYLIAQGSPEHVNESLQMHFKVAVRTFHAPNLQAGDSLTDVLRERHAVVTLLYGYLIAQGSQDAAALLLLQPQQLTTFRTSVNESLQMHFKVAVRTFHAPNLQAGDSLTDVLRERHAVVTLLYGYLIAQGSPDAAALLLVQPQHTDNPQNIIL